MGVLIPAGVVSFFFLLPFLLPLPEAHELGEWFPKSGRIAQVLAVATLLLLVLLIILAFRR